MSFCLVKNLGTPQESKHELHHGINTVGRGFDNSLVVEDDARSLSRHHAQVLVTDQLVEVKDLNSSNGTYVNNLRITEHPLKVGDTVRFGSVSFVLQRSVPISQTTEPLEEIPSDISILLQVKPEQSRNTIQQLIQTAPTAPTGASVIVFDESQDANHRLATRLKVLMEISNQLGVPQSFEKVLQKILELLFMVMRVDRGVLLLATKQRGHLEARAIKTREKTTNREFYSKKIAQYVYSQGVGIISDNAVVDNRFDSSHSIIRQTICAAMCVPLKVGDRTLGVLYVDNQTFSNIYQKDDLEFLTSLANQAAIAIENANLYEQIQTEMVRRARLERFFPQAVTRKIEEIGDLGIVETEVTALFSDISGFTAMASQMQPREVINLLNEYFKVMVEDIVFRFEGTLEKYIADALLAVWGSPYRQENDVQRALQAAIAMQWAMSKLNQKWAEEKRFPPIQIHIGLNTGQVAAGNIGSEKLIQYTNIGDTMNVASRICGVAKAGEILISDHTLNKWHSISGHPIPVESIEPKTVKGKAQPLHLYRVLWQRISPTSLN